MKHIKLLNQKRNIPKKACDYDICPTVDWSSCPTIDYCSFGDYDPGCSFLDICGLDGNYPGEKVK